MAEVSAGSFAEVVARLRATQEIVSTARLREAKRIILDEIRPALHGIALDSRTYELQDALGLLGSAAEDLDEVIHAVRQCQELTESWIADTGGIRGAST